MPQPKKGYEFFEHTADAGVRIFGATLNELFVHASQGLKELLVEDSLIAAKEPRPVNLNAGAVEALLQTWLKELLFWFATDRFLPAQYRLDVVEATRLQGEVVGERFDPARHAQGTEVKGVTYHQLQVKQTDQGWEAQVIFDV
jgi:SHS2 domain-containing protein